MNRCCSCLKILGVVFGVAYPFVIFCMLERGVSFRLLGVLIALFAVCSFLGYGKKYVAILGMSLSLFLISFENVLFLKIYPVIMNFFVAITFILSLGKQQPIIEQFALKMGYSIDEQGRRYARKSTIAWSIFLFCNFVASFVTLFLSLRIWTLYNGLISYVLIGIAFIIEFFSHRQQVAKC